MSDEKVGKTTTSLAVEKRIIPKRMNFFWASHSISWMRLMTLKSFRFYHPDWEIILHRSEPIGKKSWVSSEKQDWEIYKGPDYTDQVDFLGIKTVEWKSPISGLAPAHASDICEWQLLSGVGGFYADMDILFVGAIDYGLLRHFDVVYCLTEGYAAIGFFGSTPENEFFGDVLRTATRDYKSTRYQNTGAEAIYRMAGMPAPGWSKHHRPGDIAFRKFREGYADLKFTGLPDQTFYPYFYQCVDQIFKFDRQLPKECIGIHWFGGSILGQETNLIYTADNYRDYRCTYTSYAARIECST